VFSVDTANLQFMPIADCAKSLHIFGEFGQTDMDTGPHGGSEVGGTAGQIAQPFVESECKAFLEFGNGVGEAGEYLSDISAGLHGDDAELILFVDPDEESFVVVVVDAASFGPVTVESGAFEKAVALFEEKVILDELFSVLLTESREGIVTTGELSGEGFESVGDHAFDDQTFSAGEIGPQREAVEIAPHTDAGGEDVGIVGVGIVDLQMIGIHIADVVLCPGIKVVILPDDRIQQGSEKGITLFISGVDTDGTVGIVDSGSYQLIEGVSVASLFVTELFIEFGGQMTTQCRCTIFGEMGVGHSLSFVLFIITYLKRNKVENLKKEKNLKVFRQDL